MILAGNKKAYFDYFVEEKFEAGIELQGSEVKSAKAGKVSIKESFVRIINGELFIMGMSIVPWSYGSIYNPEEKEFEGCFCIKRNSPFA
ncbi:SsrA-binding protein [Fusobacterium necrophorum subsp. funduliforme 1_1_36S]|nr:SsrA-binding protein [Fusobacterium necrophorum subsp. funduliforme 1_1_36S]